MKNGVEKMVGVGARTHEGVVGLVSDDLERPGSTDRNAKFGLQGYLNSGLEDSAHAYDLGAIQRYHIYIYLRGVI